MPEQPRRENARTPRAREMARVLNDLERSGLSQREFCRKRGIPLSTLTWWRRKLRDVRSAAERPRRLAQAAFVELEVSRDEPGLEDACVEIRLPGGAVVRVDPAVSDDTLSRVFRAARLSCRACRRR